MKAVSMFGCVLLLVGFAAAAAEPEVLFEVGPSDTVARASEGDLIVLNDGRWLLGYSEFPAQQSGRYAAHHDHAKARIVTRVSSDAGRTWSEPTVAAEPEAGDLNVMSVSFLRLRDGRLALFYGRKRAESDGRPVMRISADEGRTWGPAQDCVDDAHRDYYVLNNARVVRLSTGRIVLPLCRHSVDAGDPQGFESEGRLCVAASDDDGRSWRMICEPFKVFDRLKMRVTVQEPGIVELKDGRLLMYARTNRRAQWGLWSSDGGATWSQAEPLPLVSPNLAPATITRLSDGNLVAFWNDYSKKPADPDKIAFAEQREPFSIAWSKDDGRTWSPSRTVDSDPPGSRPNLYCCYFAVREIGDALYAFHCHHNGLKLSHLTKIPLAWVYEEPGPATASVSAAVDFREPVIVPRPAKLSFDAQRAVPLEDATCFQVSCPDESASAWIAAKAKLWWKISPSVVPFKATLPDDDEGYSVTAEPGSVTISARTLQGVRYAMATLRQAAEPRPSGLGEERYWLAAMRIEDAPTMKFRGLHLCCFPELSAEYVERQIRLAAYYKFNFVVLESWGMFKSEKFPFLAYADSWLTPAEARRLATLAKDLGLTLVPQFNVFGHAAGARHCSGKHVTLDFHPAYQSLFEPGGWNWCLTNPETLRVQRELLAEMQAAFLDPPFVHIGCDEANLPSCARCRAAGPYERLFVRHVTAIADFLRSRGARTMMWHDMLLDRGDARWKGFYANGTPEVAELLRTSFPKDVVVCDWYYGKKVADHPTLRHFKELGFDAVACPYMDEPGETRIAEQADFVRRHGLFGLLQTTWTNLSGEKFALMVETAAASAWGTSAPPKFTPEMGGAPIPRPFATHWRQVGWDMEAKSYRETGYVDHQMTR